MLLKEQAGVCVLCVQVIREGQETLDHDHDTGHVRAVLCRNCNHIEGRMKSWAKRSGVPVIDFIRNLLDFLESDHTHNPFHPNHLTDDEKTIKMLKKRMKTLKKESTKQRYRERINTLKSKLERIP
jgi:predicted metal-dependent hydrolase